MWYGGNPLTTRIDWKPTSIGKSIVVVPPPVSHWWYSGNPLTTRLDWKPNFIGGSTVVAAQYRVIQPHWINNNYYDVGTVLTEGSLYTSGELPSNWVPTLAVDPLNTRAVDAFYAAGPRHISYDDLARWANSQWVNVAPSTLVVPVTYWVKRGNQFFLTGLGSDQTKYPPISVPPMDTN
jgi:hypothetical protein